MTASLLYVSRKTLLCSQRIKQLSKVSTTKLFCLLLFERKVSGKVTMATKPDDCLLTVKKLCNCATLLTDPSTTCMFSGSLNESRHCESP